MTGQLTDEFRIEELSGESDIGKQYRAVQTRKNRRVMITAIHPHLVSDDTVRSQCKIEISRATRLKHPNVAGIYGYREYENQLFLISEPVEGTFLDQYLRERGPLAETDATHLFYRLLSTFTYVHRQGIRHGNIHPESILITPGQELRVIHFGLSDLVSRIIRAPGHKKNAAYRSPEQLRGNNFNLRSDIYSLGCILHTMLSGQAPDSQAIPTAGPVQEVINRARAHSAEERFSDCEEFYSTLRDKELSVQAGEQQLVTLLMQEVTSNGKPRPEVKLPTVAEYRSRKAWKRRIRVGALGLVAGAAAYLTFPYALLAAGYMFNGFATAIVRTEVPPAAKPHLLKNHLPTPVTNAAEKHPAKPALTPVPLAGTENFTAGLLPASDPAAVPESTPALSGDERENSATRPRDDQPSYLADASGKSRSRYRSTTLTPLAQDLRDTIRSYYQTMQAQDLNSLLAYYEPPLEQFFREKNVSEKQLNTLIRQAWQRTPEARYDIIWDTFKYRISNKGYYEVEYWMDYTYRRANRDEPDRQRIFTKMKLNYDYKIIHTQGD
jgi:serine/threonine protein kinase